MSEWCCRRFEEITCIFAAMRMCGIVAILLVWTFPSTAPRVGSDLALVHARIYRSPTAPPIDDGAILVHAGRIVSVGPTATTAIPPSTTVIDCHGLVVTAGFWNSHVHLLTPSLLRAKQLSSEQITTQLQEMFTRWGFTTVFDAASVLENTSVIRRRIEDGEARGPRILTVGEPFWGKGGTPIYVKGFLEANHIAIPEVESATQAAARVRQEIRDGADGIKIFANSIEADGILTMPVDLAKAIVAEAHGAGKPVFAHVSNDAGIEVALKSGVDILTHTTPIGELWSAAFATRLVAAHVALTPTLTLWDFEGQRGHAARAEIEKGMARAALQLKAFSRAGGQVLFGTDVGYIDTVDTTEEFAGMSNAGMDFPEILASLTTNPATRFRYATRSGHIEKGMEADFVVLDGDPAKDVTAFSRVHQVIRGGQLIYPVGM